MRMSKDDRIKAIEIMEKLEDVQDQLDNAKEIIEEAIQFFMDGGVKI